MSRYIDADNLADVIDCLDTVEGQGNAVFAYDVIQAINDAPTADVQEIRHGQWEEDEETGDLQCSECGHFTGEFFGDFVRTEWGLIHRTLRPTYCSKCGAKMDGKEDKK